MKIETRIRHSRAMGPCSPSSSMAFAAGLPYVFLVLFSSTFGYRVLNWRNGNEVPSQLWYRLISHDSFAELYIRKRLLHFYFVTNCMSSRECGCNIIGVTIFFLLVALLNILVYCLASVTVNQL